MAEENTNQQNEQTEPETTPQPQQQTAPAAPQQPTEPAPALRTFTQEQLDAIIARERTKATKGWFSKEQMDAKDNTIAALTAERDAANADKAKLQTELDGYKNEKFLVSKGVPAEMVDFYAFKIGKLVTKDKTFEQAAEEYIKDNPPTGTVRMSTGGGVSGGGDTKPDHNATMNAIIRGKK